jgi:hypothetical protein
MSMCKSCAAGPKGIEGHLDLFVSTMSGSAMKFKCQTCGALWTRRQGAGGPDWAEAGSGEMGATLPRSAKS